MILKAGSNVLVVHRRLFDEDHPRFFLGQVEDYEEGIARITGYSFGRHESNQNIVRKPDIRTKIVPVRSGTLLIYCLPDEVSVENTAFTATGTGLCLTCPPAFSLNLSEWILAR